MPYDPEAAAKALKQARTKLAGCFYRKDDNGQVLEGKYGLDGQNGQKKDQFLHDLMRLADCGRTLFYTVFGTVSARNPDGSSMAPRDWTEKLQQALASGCIIQIARTGRANYVFPWALLYDYPMPGTHKERRMCPVTNEWSDDGIRKGGPQERCPYEDESYHDRNIYCPYGFWGLKHIVEQPLAWLTEQNANYELSQLLTKIGSGQQPLSVGVGATTTIAAGVLNGHLARLGTGNGLHINPPTAFDRAAVGKMLPNPSILYFLCHGEFDDGQDSPYLGIGPRDSSDEHRVYPNNIQDWAQLQRSRQMPLVFINGCHTCNLTPGDLLNFVTAFAFAGASGVIGTEVSVTSPVAVEVGEKLLKCVAKHSPVGQAMREMRWELANKGNLLGLAYTCYGMAHLAAPA